MVSHGFRLVFVTHTEDTQSWNLYSYMHNNTLGQRVSYAICTIESVGLHGVWIDVNENAGTT